MRPTKRFNPFFLKNLKDWYYPRVLDQKSTLHSDRKFELIPTKSTAFDCFWQRSKNKYSYDFQKFSELLKLFCFSLIFIKLTFSCRAVMIVFELRKTILTEFYCHLPDFYKINRISAELSILFKDSSDSFFILFSIKCAFHFRTKY